MPARSRMRERAPSAATRRRARDSLVPSVQARAAHRIRSRRPSKSATATARSSTPSSLRLREQRREQRTVLDHVGERLARSSTSPSKVRNTGRTASLRRLSVTAMSRIGCASPATRSHTPMVSNSRRAAATIAEARASLRRAAERRIGDRDRKPSARAPAAARSPAPGRQSRRRRSARRRLRARATMVIVAPSKNIAMVAHPRASRPARLRRRSLRALTRRGRACPPPSKTSSPSSTSSRSR